MKIYSKSTHIGLSFALSGSSRMLNFCCRLRRFHLGTVFLNLFFMTLILFFYYYFVHYWVVTYKNGGNDSYILSESSGYLCYFFLPWVFEFFLHCIRCKTSVHLCIVYIFLLFSNWFCMVCFGLLALRRVLLDTS